MDKIIKDLDDIIDDGFEKMTHSKTDSERNDWNILTKRLVMVSHELHAKRAELRKMVRI